MNVQQILTKKLESLKKGGPQKIHKHLESVQELYLILEQIDELFPVLELSELPGFGDLRMKIGLFQKFKNRTYD